MGRPIKPGTEWIRFRPSPELRQLIERTAQQQRRTLSAEIILRLERDFEREGDGEQLARAS